jgi:hypothetical protein
MLDTWQKFNEEKRRGCFDLDIRQSLEQALRRKQAREWDRVLQFDTPYMRQKDKQAHFDRALLTRYNDDISDEEASRRLKSLPGEATLRALRVLVSSGLRPAEWTQVKEFSDEEWSQLVGSFEAAKAGLAGAFHKPHDQCRKMTVSWFEEERKRCWNDLQLTIQLDRGLDERFWEIREWRFREAKQKREVAVADTSVKEWRSHMDRWSYEMVNNKESFDNRWRTLQRTPAMIQ